MTGKERIKAVLEGRPADIVPRTPILMQYAAEFIGSNYGRFAADYRVLVEANLRCAAAFGFDQVSVISDAYRETQGFGGRVTYVENGTPRSTHPLADDPDLSRLAKPDPLKSERMLDRVEAVRAYARAAGDYSILGWVEGPAAEGADLRGVENFLVDLLDEPAYAADLMDLVLENGIAFAMAQIEAGCDMVGIGDAIASQIGPDLYREFVLPREVKLVRAIQGQGVKVKLHICGDITPLLPGLAEVAPDVLDCDHMVDLAEARRVMPKGTVLTGNLDPVAAVLRGKPETIRAAVRAAYAVAGNPYFVNAGCEIPSGTPQENLRALCEPLAFQP